MSNYPYIIAGLPDLLLDFESRPFDFCEMKDGIAALCDEADQKRIDWLLASLDGKHYSTLFYKGLDKSTSRFTREYVNFDKDVRNAKVKFLQTGTLEEESELSERLEPIFKIKNLIEREMAIDKLYWEKINEITLQEYLTFDIILSFLAKAKLVERWNKLDQMTGAELFKQLVNEVRGTFTGLKFE